MQTMLNSKFIVGVFKKELKNRFLCEVNIDGIDVVCYVPSSCHLSNFLQLEGKNVLLIPTQTPKARTRFALFAVPYKKNYILLNTSMANRVIESNICNRRFSFLGERKSAIKEHTIENYKTDLYLPKTKTIIEIKSVISLNDTAIFPTVYSERSIAQLKQIYNLLNEGYKVCFMIVSMHPYTKKIKLDIYSEFYKKLHKCQEAGLILKAYTCRINKNNICIDKQIEIEY